MLFIENLKFSCSGCLKGHRSKSCIHVNRIHSNEVKDYVYLITDRGRPKKGSIRSEADKIRLIDADVSESINPRCPCNPRKFSFQCKDKCCSHTNKHVHLVPESIKMIKANGQNISINNLKDLPKSASDPTRIYTLDFASGNGIKIGGGGSNMNYQKFKVTSKPPFNFNKVSKPTSTSKLRSVNLPSNLGQQYNMSFQTGSGDVVGADSLIKVDYKTDDSNFTSDYDNFPLFKLVQNNVYPTGQIGVLSPVSMSDTISSSPDRSISDFETINEPDLRQIPEETNGLSAFEESFYGSLISNGMEQDEFFRDIV